LTPRHIGVHGDEAFVEGALVFWVESMPEDGVAFANGYPTSAKEDLALVVKLPLVVDDVGLVTHALPGILGGEVDEFLPQELPLGCGADVLITQLVAEVEPIACDVSWQVLPNVSLGAVNVPNYCLHLLQAGEAALVR